jgi:hypothetical protein
MHCNECARRTPVRGPPGRLCSSYALASVREKPLFERCSAVAFSVIHSISEETKENYDVTVHEEPL